VELEEKASLLFCVNSLIQTFKTVAVCCGYFLRFHLASDWSQNNKHCRNFFGIHSLMGKTVIAIDVKKPKN